MSLPACRSSGLLTADALIVTGQRKLVSVHATNLHANTASTIVVYDNTAASGKIVAKLYIPPVGYDAGGAPAGGISSWEYDMHGVLCRNGLYVDVTGGTPNLTIEYS